MTFQAAAQGWRSFYSIAGAASASLAGLLFVGLSLHLRLVVSRTDVRSLARVTLSSFAVTLILALVMVIPGQSAVSTGQVLLGIGIGAGLLVAPSFISGTRSSEHTISVWTLLLRFGLSALSYLGLVVGGALLLGHHAESALTLLTPITIVLLVISLRNTWDLLVSVGTATMVPSMGHDSATPGAKAGPPSNVPSK